MYCFFSSNADAIEVFNGPVFLMPWNVALKQKKQMMSEKPTQFKGLKKPGRVEFKFNLDLKHLKTISAFQSLELLDESLWAIFHNSLDFFQSTPLEDSVVYDGEVKQEKIERSLDESTAFDDVRVVGMANMETKVIKP